jgi:hypothetical protein
MDRNFPSTFQPILVRLESTKAAEILASGEVLSYLLTKNRILARVFTRAAVPLPIYLGWKGKKGWKGGGFASVSAFRPFRPFQADRLVRA